MNERLINTNIEEENKEVSVEEYGVIEVEVSEGLGYAAGEAGLHSTLPDRNYPNQHEIDSIAGLRDELNFIQSPRTIYSNGNNVAAYYEWESLVDNPYGCFVSIVDGCKIKICNGADVVGVVVEDAGFIGNRADIAGDGSYGLVATSGIVDVRCELGVKVGDYVVPNLSGYAEKSTGNYGYKVLGTATKNNLPHAIIALGVQADVTGAICADLNATKDEVKANYNNIVAAMNLANDAFNKANDMESLAGSASKDANDAKDKADKADQNASNAIDAAGIAKDIADSAKIACTDAFNRANDAWAKADNVATETYSLCAKIDQYSVGEYSQARGLTFDQAQEILVPGMIYAPTKHGEVEYHTEVYEYTNAPEMVESIKTIETRDPSKVYYDGKEYLYCKGGSWYNLNKMPTYERIFTPGYLYQWGYLPAFGRNGWITIDKYHNVVNYNSDIETNDASKSVYFFSTEPDIAEGDDFGYWYTDADEIKDKDGNTGAYNPYTLYKWEGDHWLAVATLVGNCNNRAVSLVSQTANSLSAEITNARGSAASIGERITNTESEVYSIAQWKDETDESIAAVKLTADGAQASIANIVEWVGQDGVVNTSSIVQSINDSGSEVYIDADHIRLEGIVTMDSNITITEDGKIIAKNADIEGKITAQSGYIGNGTSGFEIGNKAIYNKYSKTIGDIYVGYHMSSPGADVGTYYLTSEDQTSFVYIGTDGVGTTQVVLADGDDQNNKNAKQLKTWMANGELHSDSAEITGKITATSGYIGNTGGGFEIGDHSIYNTLLSSFNDRTYYMTSPRGFKKYDSDIIDAQAGGIAPGNVRGYVYVGTDGIGTMNIGYISPSGENNTQYGEIVSHTYIENGKLFSDNAEIIGNITATSGHIGSIVIDSSGLRSQDVDDNVIWKLNGSGLHIPSSFGAINVGNISIYNNIENNNISSNILATGELAILAANGTGIKFVGDGESDEKNITVGIQIKNIMNENYATTYAKAVASTAPIYDLEFDVSFKAYSSLNDSVDLQARTVRFKIKKGSTESDEVELFTEFLYDTLYSYYNVAMQLINNDWASVAYETLNSDNEYRFIAQNYNTYEQKNLKEEVHVVGHLISDNGHDIGTSEKKWGKIYAQEINVNGIDIAAKISQLEQEINTIKNS